MNETASVGPVPFFVEMHMQSPGETNLDLLEESRAASVVSIAYKETGLNHVNALLPAQGNIFPGGKATALTEPFQKQPENTEEVSNPEEEDFFSPFYDSEKAETFLKFNQLAIILSVLLVTILSLFTLSLYKNNNLRARANALLQQKNEELIRAKESAEAASKTKEKFLSNISHELRTPIYAITGLTYLLLNENPTKPQEEHLNSLKFSGEHLLVLINDILDLNKLEAEKVKLVKTDFNLKEHMGAFLNTLKPTAKNRNVSLHLEMKDDVPFNLYGDMHKVSQVLMNLVSNGIKFTENGDVWIRITNLEESAKKVRLFFEVQDNGRGIHKKRQKMIFENFVQASGQINTEYGGTGLGLPIVKKVLKFLGSDIQFESLKGKGSRFYFEMSFKKSKIQQEKKLKKQKLVAVSAEEQDQIFKGKKVLVVDDNRLNQKITQRILEKRQIRCELAENGEIAVACANNKQYDAILMDVHMPVMDGVDATKIIRKTDKKTPIIALTAVSIEQELSEFLENGFTEFIPKPYETELFFEKMYAVLKTNHEDIA